MLEWTHVRSSEEDRGGAASAEESSQAAAAACEVLEAREIGMSSGKDEEKVRVANLERLKRVTGGDQCAALRRRDGHVDV